MELTDNMQLLVPLLVAIVTTISLSRLFTVSVFDQIMIDRKLPYVPDIQYSSNQTAEMVMDTNLSPIPEVTNFVELWSIVDKFKTIEEKSLPVVSNLENKILLGYIKLSQVRKILDGGVASKITGDFMLEYNECPLHLLSQTPLSQIHMLFVAACIDSAFVTHNGKLIGEVNKEVLTHAIGKQIKILF